MHVAGLINICDKKTTYHNKCVHAPRNRIYSYSYYLENQNGRIQVCQKCFKATFGESDRFLKTVIKNECSVPMTDQRGKSTPPSKLTDNKIAEVLEHINSFPAYESHYTRKYSSQKYFHSELNISTMYRQYTEKYEQPISISKYTSIFKAQNIKFKQPKIDTCTKCDTLKLKIAASQGSEKDIIIEQQKVHHLAADNAYDCKKKDIASQCIAIC